MAKFTAKSLDLDLELTTLSGEEFKIDGPKTINAEAAGAAIEKITREDEELKKSSPEKAMKIVAESLVGIYGKDEAFWLGNFDAGTLTDIRRYFVQTLSGIKKKE